MKMKSKFLIFGTASLLFAEALDARASYHTITRYQRQTKHFLNDPVLFYKELNRFLSNFDAIGMPSNKIKWWFGKPYNFSEKRLALLKSINVEIPVDEPGFTSIYYRIPRDSEIPCFHVLRFKLQNDKVVQWSIVYNSKETVPITTNVVISSDRCGSMQFCESGEFRYPLTVDKSKPIVQSKPNLVDEATRIEGPRDMNMFKIEPTVVDECKFQPGLLLEPCFYDWEYRQ